MITTDRNKNERERERRIERERERDGGGRIVIIVLVQYYVLTARASHENSVIRISSRYGLNPKVSFIPPINDCLFF